MQMIALGVVAALAVLGVTAVGTTGMMSTPPGTCPAGDGGMEAGHGGMMDGGHARGMGGSMPCNTTLGHSVGCASVHP